MLFTLSAKQEKESGLAAAMPPSAQDTQVEPGRKPAGVFSDSGLSFYV